MVINSYTIEHVYILRKVIGISFICLITSLWNYQDLPDQSSLSFRLTFEPKQTETLKKGFYISQNKKNYYIETADEYELYGLVVNKNRGTLTQTAYADLNATDLCVTWGKNVTQGIYKDIQFANYDFICSPYYQSTSSFEAYKISKDNGRLNRTQIANNHLLAHNNKLAKKIKKIKVGDQIHIKGYLLNYDLNQPQNISKTAFNQKNKHYVQNQAIYVTKLETIHHTYWHHLFRLSLLSLLIFCPLWYCVDTRIEQKDWDKLQKKNL